MKKYEILKDDFIQFEEKTLYRIRALRSFRNVRKGDIGGYIEKEDNLSHDGDAWVYGNAKVYGNAEVYGDAWVYESHHILTISSIGSRNGITTFFKTKKGISVKCGCFYGTLEEFKDKVEEVHKGTKHFKAYFKAIELAQIQIN